MVGGVAQVAAHHTHLLCPPARTWKDLRTMTAKKTPAKPAQKPAEAKPTQATAAKAEAMNTDGAPVVAVVTWRGMTLSIPPSSEDWPLEVAEAYEDGQIVRAMRGILGPEQWAQMKAKLQPKLKDLNDMAETIGKHYGFDNAGE